MFEYLSRLIQTKLWLVLATVFLGRFIFIWVSHFDLVGDESYYWDWSRRPDWCYYSKPPMVAWIIGSLTWLVGDSVVGVRLGAVLLGTAFLAVFFNTTKLFFSTSAATIALLLLLATPANAISNVIMSIDPPVCLFWISSIYYLFGALFEAKNQNWLLAGLMTGLACLSKPVALLLPLLLGLYLLSQTQTRKYLVREYLYYLVPVMVSFIPLLLWNAQHDWITLHHSQSHFVHDSVFNVKQRLETFAHFMGLQLVLWTPITLILLLSACFTACSKYSQLSPQERLLIFMGPVPLLAIIGLSLVQKVQANWPIPFYFCVLILLSGWLAEGLWLKWFKPALVTGFAMVALAYSLPLISNALNLSPALDPASRLRGWQSLAVQVDAIRHREPGNKESFILVDDHRYLVSELAFYLPDHPFVFRLPDAGKIDSQYEIWPGPVNFLNKNGLIISKKNPQQLGQKLGHAFTKITLIKSIPAQIGNSQKQQYYLYLAKNLTTWPINAL